MTAPAAPPRRLNRTGAQNGQPGDGYVPDRFLTAADLGDGTEGAAHKTVILDAATGAPKFPNGSLGFRFTQVGLGRWNLDLGGTGPVLTLHGRHTHAVPVDLPRFDAGPTEGGMSVRRGVPAIRLDGRLVTTVFDLLMARSAPAHDRHIVLLPAHRPVAVREVRRRRAGQPAGQGPVRGQDLRRLRGPGIPPRLDPVVPRFRP